MKKTTRWLSIGIGIILIIFAIYELYIHFHPNVRDFVDTLVDRQGLLTSIDRYKSDPMVMVVIAILICLLTAIPFLPVSVFCIAVGAGYGGLLGSLINAIGISAGNLAVLTSIKYTGLGKRIQHRHAPLMDEVAKMNQPLVGLTVSYAIPMVPSLLVNITASHFKYSIREMLAPVIVGSIPVAVIYALGGNLFSIGDIRVDAAVIIVFALALIAVAMTKHFRAE